MEEKDQEFLLELLERQVIASEVVARLARLLFWMLFVSLVLGIGGALIWIATILRLFRG